MTIVPTSLVVRRTKQGSLCGLVVQDQALIFSNYYYYCCHYYYCCYYLLYYIAKLSMDIPTTWVILNKGCGFPVKAQNFWYFVPQPILSSFPFQDCLYGCSLGSFFLGSDVFMGGRQYSAVALVWLSHPHVLDLLIPAAHLVCHPDSIQGTKRVWGMPSPLKKLPWKPWLLKES